MIPRVELYVNSRMRIPEERAAQGREYRERAAEMRRAKRRQALRRWFAGEMVPTLVIGGVLLLGAAVLMIGLVSRVMGK